MYWRVLRTMVHMWHTNATFRNISFVFKKAFAYKTTHKREFLRFRVCLLNNIRLCTMVLTKFVPTAISADPDNRWRLCVLLAHVASCTQETILHILANCILPLKAKCHFIRKEIILQPSRYIIIGPIRNILSLWETSLQTLVWAIMHGKIQCTMRSEPTAYCVRRNDAAKGLNEITNYWERMAGFVQMTVLQILIFLQWSVFEALKSHKLSHMRPLLLNMFLIDWKTHAFIEEYILWPVLCTWIYQP